ncbi:MAG: sigma-70 family RNA polymerase sigma factor, partial [Planctomycetes bacterium]|nr:sigma-70 family RNA polymerase sigma factor [Planctomycetota bacterium]
MNRAIEGEELLAQRGFLRRLARGLLGDDGLAEDVVQEVELRALERGPGPGGSLRAWLVTATRRLALNVLRARERRAVHERAASKPEAIPGQAAVLAGLDLQRRVLEAVRALDEPYREALWQRYYEERTPSEIAALALRELAEQGPAPSEPERAQSLATLVVQVRWAD